MADATHDFKKYDGLGAAGAAKFVAEIEDDAEFRAFVAHEYGRKKPRATVLTDAVTARLDALNIAAQAAEDPPADGPQIDVDLAKDPDPGAKADALQGDLSDVTAEDIAPVVVSDEETERRAEARQDARDHVEALLKERRGYVLYGTEDQVSDVDAELDRVGFDGDREPNF